MARFAVIQAGVVVNVVEAGSADDLPDLQLVPATADAVKGAAWNGASFTPPATVASVPSSVTMRQARLALLAAGLLGAVEDAIDALPEPQRSAARIAWEYSGEVQRHFGLVSSLAPALGLADAQVDDLFRQAAAL